MPEPADALAYLADLQKNAFLDNARTGSDYEPEKAVAAAELLGHVPGVPEEFTVTERTPPSEFQNPADFLVLSVLLDRLDETARRVGFPAPAKTAFGTVGLGYFGAQTLAVPDSDETVVLFQEGSFPFIQLLAQFVIEAMGGSDDGTKTSLNTNLDAIAKRQLEHPDISRDFALGVTNYLIQGDATYALRRTLDPVYQLPVRALLLSADLFVLCHEYAHVLLRHPFTQNGADAPAAENTLPLPQQRELEADALGLKMSTSAMWYTARCDLSVAYWGPALVFCGLDLVDRALSLLEGRPSTRPPSTTHPPLELRRQGGDYTLRSQSPEQAEDAIHLADVVVSVVDSLWPRLEESLHIFGDAGFAPARIFRTSDAT